MTYTIDLTTVLKSLFFDVLTRMPRSSAGISWPELKEAFEAYERSGSRKQIHHRISQIFQQDQQISDTDSFRRIFRELAEDAEVATSSTPPPARSNPAPVAPTNPASVVPTNPAPVTPTNPAQVAPIIPAQVAPTNPTPVAPQSSAQGTPSEPSRQGRPRRKPCSWLCGA
jgi:hypothetical protein